MQWLRKPSQQGVNTNIAPLCLYLLFPLYPSFLLFSYFPYFPHFPRSLTKNRRWLIAINYHLLHWVKLPKQLTNQNLEIMNTQHTNTATLAGKIFIILVLIFTANFKSGFAQSSDTIIIGNASIGNATGLLVDGNNDPGNQVNDSTFISLTGKASVGSFNPSAFSNEIIAFNVDRPVAVSTNVPWTTGNDNISVNFSNKIMIPITIWIVNGNFSTQKAKAIAAVNTAAAIWSAERMGVGFSSVTYIDATKNKKSRNYNSFTCSLQAGLQSDIGMVAGQVNVYYVGTVDGGSDRGQSCAIGSSFIALAANSLSDLLCHELGHGFGLTHIDDLTTYFDATNVMYSASSVRQFFTEGQLFRAHTITNSTLNALYHARPGQVTRLCARDDSSLTCPTIHKRIWADGTFPAN